MVFHGKYIYAVNDDESDNEDVSMVTDASSSLQETSLVVYVSISTQSRRDRENDN